MKNERQCMCGRVVRLPNTLPPQWASTVSADRRPDHPSAS
jgi:hypothetical protein